MAWAHTILRCSFSILICIKEMRRHTQTGIQGELKGAGTVSVPRSLLKQQWICTKSPPKPKEQFSGRPHSLSLLLWLRCWAGSAWYLQNPNISGIPNEKSIGCSHSCFQLTVSMRIGLENGYRYLDDSFCCLHLHLPTSKLSVAEYPGWV